MESSRPMDERTKPVNEKGDRYKHLMIIGSEGILHVPENFNAMPRVEIHADLQENRNITHKKRDATSTPRTLNAEEIRRLADATTNRGYPIAFNMVPFKEKDTGKILSNETYCDGHAVIEFFPRYYWRSY